MTKRTVGWCSIGRTPTGGPDPEYPNAMILDVGRLGVNVLAGGSWSLFPCGGRVRGFNIQRGRSFLTDHYQAGTATVVLDNRDGELTPYATPTAGRPGMGAPLVLAKGDTAQTGDLGAGAALFTGVVTRIAAARYGSDDVVVVDAVDRMRALSDTDLPARSSEGAGETAGPRIARVLGLLTLPDGPPDAILDAGDITLQGSTFAQPLITDALLAADTEGGNLFVDRFGRFRFYDRAAYTTDPPAARAELTPTPGDPYRYGVRVAVEVTADTTRNDIRLARAGGSERRSVNTTSVGQVGRRNWKRADLIAQADDDVQVAANFYAALWGDVDIRFAPVRLDCEYSQYTAALYPTLELADIVCITAETADGDVTRDVRVESLTWEYTPAAGLAGTMGVSTNPASLSAFLTLNDATLGKLSAGNRLS